MKADEPKGRAKGGIATAKAMTEAQRKARAQKGAMARWGKPMQASHKGNFKEQLGIDVECYVLDDLGKTPVISQSGMARVLGMSPRANTFTKFIASKSMADSVSAELAEKLQKPFVFQWGVGGAEQPPSTVYGVDATLLIDVCNAISDAHAKGRLGARYDNIVKQAAIITGASAKSGIRNLVYALSGYDATREEVITAFKMYVREEAREYEKEFPDQLYEQWYRLYKLPKPERNKPWKFKHLTVNQVYQPLARSNGKIHQLLAAQRAASGQKSKKLHEFLADVGVKALRTHLGQLLGIAQISGDEREYEKHVNKVFGSQQTLDL